MRRGWRATEGIRFLIPITAMALAMLFLAACGSNDASVSARDTGPAEKVNFPNKFDTVATKCSHGIRLFLTQNHSDKASSIAAVRDPSCTR